MSNCTLNMCPNCVCCHCGFLLFYYNDPKYHNPILVSIQRPLQNGRSPYIYKSLLRFKEPDVFVFFFFFIVAKSQQTGLASKSKDWISSYLVILSSFSGLVNVIFLPYNCNIFYTLNEHALTYTSFCEHCLKRDKIGGHYKPARRRLYLPSWRSRPCHQYFPWAPPFKVIRPPKKILNKRMNT